MWVARSWIFQILPQDLDFRNLAGKNGTFQILPARSGIFQILPVRSGIFQVLPARSWIFQILPAKFGIFQTLPAGKIWNFPNLAIFSFAVNVLKTQSQCPIFRPWILIVGWCKFACSMKASMSGLLNLSHRQACRQDLENSRSCGKIWIIQYLVGKIGKFNILPAGFGKFNILPARFANFNILSARFGKFKI